SAPAWTSGALCANHSGPTSVPGQSGPFSLQLAGAPICRPGAGHVCGWQKRKLENREQRLAPSTQRTRPENSKNCGPRICLTRVTVGNIGRDDFATRGNNTAERQVGFEPACADSKNTL